MNVDWVGVYPALTTKFTEDYKLDISSYLHNIRKQIDAGVHAVVIGGSLGEASTLLQEEKIQLLVSTVDQFGDQIPIIMNVAEQSTAAAINAVVNAQENGANGIMMLPPMRYSADKRETLTFYEVVAKSVDLPIMVYNNPIDYKIEITLDMFDELAKYDNIQSVKESTRNVTNVTRMRNNFGNRFKILCGVDTLALEELLLGTDSKAGGYDYLLLFTQGKMVSAKISAIEA